MQNINPKIFRAYDVRGVYPDEINANLAYLLGRAVVIFLKEKEKKDDLNVVLSRDGRISSPELFEAVKKGILEQGANVIDIGLVPTQVLYFAVWHYGYDGGAQVTASHNPSQFNGFKLMQKESAIAANTGMDKIKEMVLEMASKDLLAESAQKGEVIKKDVLDDYLEFNLKQFNLAGIKPFKIAVDTANGAGSELIKKLSQKLPGEIFHLADKVDGSFPSHAPDPSKPENLKQLSDFIKEKDVDLGVAFDADGDRIFLMDEKGQALPSHLTLSLLSRIILKENPGEKIVYTVCMSNIVKETIKENNGTPLVAKVGFTFVKEMMKDNNAIYGGEFSGHFLHRDHCFCEAPLFVFLSVLKVLSQTGKTVSQLVEPFRKYVGAEKTINLEVKDKQKALQVLEQKYQDGKVSHLDGVRVDFEHWWFNARPSNTEDVLRLVIEADNQELSEKNKQEIMQILQ